LLRSSYPGSPTQFRNPDRVARIKINRSQGSPLRGQPWVLLHNRFAVENHKCFRKKVAIFQASIAFQGISAVV
jgi:hypothetical protein